VSNSPYAKRLRACAKRGRGVHFVPLNEIAEQEVNDMVARSYPLDAEESYERGWAGGASTTKRFYHIRVLP
jgi:hypothetical protein